MQGFGEYISPNGTSDINYVEFWGEWEPNSHFFGKKINPGHGLPKYLFSPYLTNFVPGRNYQNTDPFVFGEQFYYAICRQGHSPILRNLEDYSLILFGFCLGNQFVLDTVFVVKQSTPYSINNYKNLLEKTNPTFYETSIHPIMDAAFACAPGEINYGCVAGIGNYKLYSGIMKKDGKELFSFVPCKPFRNLNNWGFTRPVITENKKLHRGGYISQDLNQNFRATEVSYNIIRLVWLDIVEQVKNAGLSMMVQTDMPVKK